MQQTEFEQVDIVALPSADALGILVISLLKGVVYKRNDERLWNSLLKLQARVRDYVGVLGLELILDEAEEYAFMRSATRLDPEDLTSIDAPRLVARRPLSFPVSLLLALLRKKLAEMDARSGDTRLVLSRNEVVELIRVFLPECTNDTKLVRQIDTHLNKIVDLGFLRRLKAPSQREDTFEVQRILKAFIDADWLARLDERLDAYKVKLLADEG